MSNKDTQFKPGESGNPNGRPKKGDSWADILKEALSEEVDYKGDKKTYKRLIAEVLRKHALKGDPRHLQMIMDRMDGKPNQKIEAEGDIKINSPMAEAIKALREKDAKN
jgi:hypothetical protein